MAADQVKALIYDVFGTVVDWRSSVIREGKALGEAKGVQVDWSQFADEWRKDRLRWRHSEDPPWRATVYDL